MPPQKMLLWHKDYYLACEIKQTQEMHSALTLHFFSRAKIDVRG